MHKQHAHSIHSKHVRLESTTTPHPTRPATMVHQMWSPNWTEKKDFAQPPRHQLRSTNTKLPHTNTLLQALSPPTALQGTSLHQHVCEKQKISHHFRTLKCPPTSEVRASSTLQLLSVTNYNMTRSPAVVLVFIQSREKICKKVKETGLRTSLHEPLNFALHTIHNYEVQLPWHNSEGESLAFHRGGPRSVSGESM